MPSRKITYIGTACILVLIALSAVLTVDSLGSIQWSLGSGKSETSNSSVSPRQGLGYLLVNASFFFGGVENPIAGALVSISASHGKQALFNNMTNANGTLVYGLAPGNYQVVLSSSYGHVSDVVLIENDNTTLFNYVSVNETESAVSFDIVTQQPAIVSPWDSVYVRVPDVFVGLNLSALYMFIEPVYGSLNSSIRAGNVSSAAQGGRSPLIPVHIVSEENLTPSNGLVWLRLQPLSGFSTTGLGSISVTEYSASVSVSTSKGSPPK